MISIVAISLITQMERNEEFGLLKVLDILMSL